MTPRPRPATASATRDSRGIPFLQAVEPPSTIQQVHANARAHEPFTDQAQRPFAVKNENHSFYKIKLKLMRFFS